MTFSGGALLLLAFMAFGLAASGFLFEASTRKVGVAFFLGWFVPGAGHFLLGRRVKAAVLFGLLALIYIVGLWLCGWRMVSFDDNPFYYVGQFGSGLTSILGQLLADPKAFPRPELPPKWIDPGMLYVCVAGLLNIVIMMSVFGAPPAPPPKEQEP
jgi:hypothetical protein